MQPSFAAGEMPKPLRSERFFVPASFRFQWLSSNFPLQTARFSAPIGVRLPTIPESGLPFSEMARCVLLHKPQTHPENIMAKGFVAITVERCKGCGFCVEFCPTHVLALSSAYNSKGYHPPNVVASEKCSGCDLCGMYCPDFAIFGARYAR